MEWAAIFNSVVPILTVKEMGSKSQECQSRFTSRGGENEVSDRLNVLFLLEPGWRLGKFAKWGDLVMGLESFHVSVQAVCNY